nr:tripartite tricarboxylate transporter substrate binding protein [Variovorax paradoxus]
MITQPDSLFRDLRELAGYARANPGKVAYGTPGVGTVPHLAAELFQIEGRVQLNHVPYKGATQQIQDLIGGLTQVDFQSSLAVALPHLQSGRIKAIAVLSEQRSPLLPQVPTAKESGYPTMVVAPWFGLGAPAGVPGSMVERMHAALVKGLSSKEIDAKFVSLGFTLSPSASPADFAAQIRSEHARWGKIIKAANVKNE